MLSWRKVPGFAVLAFCICCIGSLHAQKKLSRADRIAILNSGLIDDVERMEEAAQPELKVYNIQNGDTLADIGFGWAWLEGLLSVLHDSLTIYANDVEKQALNNLERVLKGYEALRESPNTNTIVKVKGTAQSTLLPDSFFTKVIVRETFHHFSHPEAMLLDLKRILKKNGRIYMLEPVVDETGISNLCGAPNYTEADMRAFFSGAGLKLLYIHDLSHLPPYSVPWNTFTCDDCAPLVIYELGN